jgi:[acyl-carrier-protein] S-malonyltransferase
MDMLETPPTSTSLVDLTVESGRRPRSLQGGGMTPIFMFPGQSSKYPEMIDRLCAWAEEEALGALGEASDALGRDLRAHYRAENPAIFATNRDVQIGVFLANHIHLLALQRAGVHADLSLGLSLGEYNHLVHIGAIDFIDAVRLVDARGAAYDAGPLGAMASVFPLPIDELEEVVTRARELGTLEIVNLNSPTQNVIAGARAAIDAASAILEDEFGGVECRVIEQRVPMHASIFAPVATALRPKLDHARFRMPGRPYLPNVLGRFEEEPHAPRIADLLAQHVYSPVLFRASIDFLAERYPDAAFIEVGPRAVLYNLLNKKWRKNPRFKTDAPEDPGRAFQTTTEELIRAA